MASSNNHYLECCNCGILASESSYKKAKHVRKQHVNSSECSSTRISIKNGDLLAKMKAKA